MACEDTRQLTEAQRQAAYQQQRTGVQRAVRPFTGTASLPNLIDYINRELMPAVKQARSAVNDVYLQVADNAPSANPLGYYFSTETGAADPTTGRVRLNASPQSGSTVLRISQTNGRLVDVLPWLEVMSGSVTEPLGVVTLADAINPGRFLRADLDTMVDQGAYWDLGITITEASHPDPFVDAEAVTLAFIPGVADNGGLGAQIPPDSITPIATDTFLGNISGASASPVAVPLADVDSTSIVYDATSHTFQSAAKTGDVTAPQNSNATTIANDAVTNAKLANMAEALIKGRALAAGTGDPQDLTATQVKAILGTVAWTEVEETGAGPFNDYNAGATDDVHLMGSNAAGVWTGVLGATQAGRRLLVTHQGTGYTQLNHNDVSSTTPTARFFNGRAGLNLRLHDNEAALYISADATSGGTTSIRWILVSPLMPFAHSSVSATGDVLVFDGSNWVTLNIGTNSVLGRVAAGVVAAQVVTAQIADDNVTDAKLRNSGALSVIGRAGNSSGDPADISAVAAAGGVLRESGSTVGFGTISLAAFPSLADDTFLANIAGVSAQPTAVPLTTLAGAGLTGGADAILAVGAGTHITVNANDVAVDVTTLLAAIDSTSVVVNTGTLERAALTGAITAAQNSNATLFDTNASGAGLTGGGTAIMAVGAGTGITVNPNDVAVTIPLTDGDKGDITVASSGTAWTIDASAVTLAKMENRAQATVIGRASGAGTGAPQELTAAQVATIVRSAAWTEVEETGAGPFNDYNATVTSHVHLMCSNAAGVFTGVLGGTAGAMLLISHQGTGFTELQNNNTGSVTASSRFFNGRLGKNLRIHDNEAALYIAADQTAGAGVAIRWMLVSPCFPFAQSDDDATGDIIAYTGSNYARIVGGNSANVVLRGNATFGTVSAGAIASDAVTTVKILDANVTLAKMANLAQSTIIGRASGAGTGVPTALTGAQVRTIIGASLVARTVYTTSSGNHVMNAATVRAVVTVVAAGGAGGGVEGAAGIGHGVGAGGGAGARLVLDITSALGTHAYVVGSGGNGAAGLAGGDGDDSSFHDGAATRTAEGGAGGAVQALDTDTAVGTGGAGGARPSSGGAVVERTGGNPGAPAWRLALEGLPLGCGGHGGSGPWGGGGFGRDSNSSPGDGSDATGYGSGGGGAYSTGSATDRSGGDGFGGLIIVEEYS